MAVKKHAGLLDDLTNRDRFDVFGRLGPALCPDGWAQSFLREEFEHTIEGVLLVAYRRGPNFAVSEACALAWELATLHYVLDAATEPQLTTWRATNDRDVRRALSTLEELGAVRLAGDTVALTERGLAGMRRATGDPEPGDAIRDHGHLARRHAAGVAAPARPSRDAAGSAARHAPGCDGLDELAPACLPRGRRRVRAAFGDLDYRDDREATLQGVVAEPGERLVYRYDFGDGWEHDVVIERVLAAKPDVRYPSWPGRGAARPRTAAAAPSGTPNCARFSPTRPGRSTPTCSSGSSYEPRRSSSQRRSKSTRSTPGS